MLLDLLLVAGGLLILTVGGDKLVDFASALAEKAHVTKAVIGLTIVSAGTTFPELVVSVVAAIEGSPDIALGNVVGSNLTNLTLVLGAAAVIATIPITAHAVRIDYPFCFLAGCVMLLLARDGRIDRLEGLFMLLAVVAYLGWSVWTARMQSSREERRELAETVPEHADELRHKPGWYLIGVLVLCLLSLGIGARLLITGAVSIAGFLGVSERVIGLTIVAVGTSAPEIATAIASSLKKSHELAVANVIGANILNTLFIPGAASLFGSIPVSEGFIRFDMWAMLAVTAVLGPFIFRIRHLGRATGTGFLAIYATYIAWLFTVGG
ncbi:MAG: calcium/sodium antiporter [Deltaproteobacteria bacterium]|nr:calcium/sodium antiporter [Deltaproteobacteria bacterium]